MDEQELLDVARAVQTAAHAPYSEYRVGAALETDDGSVYEGCNLEVANFSNSLHAEEVALSEAIKNGHEGFSRLVVSSNRRDGVTPCGMCRQTLVEFCDADLEILCDDDGDLVSYTLGDLIPNTITGDMID